MASTALHQKITMATAIERYFNVALYLLVLMGFGTLASTGSLDLPAVVLVGFALLLRGFLLATGREFIIPEHWTTSLTILYVFIYCADYLFISGSFLTATVHLVLFLMVVRLFSLQRTRDHFALAILSFLMVLGAAVLTVDSVFLFAFAGFLLVAVITFVLMEMRHSISETKRHALEPRTGSAHRSMGYTLLASGPALMLLILAGSSLIFFLLPRVSSRYLTAYSPASDLATGFSDRVQLGRIGQIQQSTAVVMHVQIDNDMQGAYDLKWRGVALSRFDGRVWSNAFAQVDVPRSTDGSYRLAPIANDIPRPASRIHKIHYHVVMEPLGTNVFFLTENTSRLRGNYRRLGTDWGGAFYNLDSDHPINRYEADSDVALPDDSQLRLATNRVPPDLDIYLRLPPVDIRIPQLAREITANAPDNYDKALALERYLRTRFGYTLDLPRVTPSDPLANFLFQRKQGHCEYFASAMAVMLRSLGIPARLVTGFRTGEFNDLTDQYVIRASNAHAWVEAYFPGNGWVSFDPTPAGDLPNHVGWSRLLLYVDAAASFWREWIINYDAAHQRALGQDAAVSSRRFIDDARHWLTHHYRKLLNAARRTHHQMTLAPGRWMAWVFGVSALILLLANLGGIERAVRARLLRAHPERFPQLASALWYERMVRRLARRGWRKLPSQTPRDFVNAIQEPRLQKKVEKFTRAYESARFGQSVDDARSLPELFEEITTVEK